MNCEMTGIHKPEYGEATIERIHPVTLEKVFICETCEMIEARGIQAICADIVNDDKIRQEVAIAARIPEKYLRFPKSN